jgi:hypothetical protein
MTTGFQLLESPRRQSILCGSRALAGGCCTSMFSFKDGNQTLTYYLVDLLQKALLSIWRLFYSKKKTCIGY